MNDSLQIMKKKKRSGIRLGMGVYCIVYTTEPAYSSRDQISLLSIEIDYKRGKLRKKESN